MKVRTNDKVLVTAGKDKGKTGKVIRALPKENKVIVEDVNLRKRHVRPKKEGQKGQVIKKEAPVSISNVRLVCPRCERPAGVGFKFLEKKKARICKKCGAEI